MEEVSLINQRCDKRKLPLKCLGGTPDDVCQITKNIDPHVNTTFLKPHDYLLLQCDSKGREYDNKSVFACAQRHCPKFMDGVTVQPGRCDDDVKIPDSSGDGWDGPFKKKNQKKRG